MNLNLIPTVLAAFLVTIRTGPAAFLNTISKGPSVFSLGDSREVLLMEEHCHGANYADSGAWHEGGQDIRSELRLQHQLHAPGFSKYGQ